MFNIHTTELLVVAIVALIVIGPEKLPAAVRTASLWIGRFRRSFYKVKAEIERELNADEIRRQLHNESVMEEIEEAKSKVEGAARDTEKSIGKLVSTDDFDPGASKQAYEKKASEQIDEVKKELDEVGEEVKKATRPVYGSGSNPKQASKDTGDKSSKEDNS